MKKLFYILAFVFSILAVVSCDIDSLEDSSKLGGLHMNIILADKPAVKSGEINLQSDKVETKLYLKKVTSDTFVSTKSVQINDKVTFAAKYPSFKVEGHDDKGHSIVKADASFNSSTELWDLVQRTYSWTPGTVLQLVGLATDADAATQNSILESIGFAEPAYASFDYKLNANPFAAEDMLMGYYKGVVPNNTGTVPLRFNHPLTSLQFEVGDLPEGVSITILSLDIKGLDSLAHCGVTFTADGAEYTWTNHTGTKTYHFDFPNEPMSAGTQLIARDSTLLVIPRTFPFDSEAKICMRVKEFNREYDVEASLAGQVWEPGETNVYSLEYQGLKEPVITFGPLFNDAIVDLCGKTDNTPNVQHIVFTTSRDGKIAENDVEVQAPTYWPVYAHWDNSTKTITVYTSSPNLFTGSDASYYFNGLGNLKDISGLTKLNTGNAVNMEGMFAGCKVLEEVDLSCFDTKKVIGLSSMFQGCAALDTLDLSSFVTDNVLGIGHMFSGCSELDTIKFGPNFQLPKCTGFAFTFSGASQLKTLDLSVITCNTAQDFEYMFQNCSNLRSIDMSNFGACPDLSFAQAMFEGCFNLKSVDFGPNITFANCPASTGARGFFPSRVNNRPCYFYCNTACRNRLVTYGYYSTDGRFSIVVAY